MTKPADLSVAYDTVCERPFFGPDATFHHVGMAVNSIEEVSPSSRPQVDQAQGVRTAFMDVHGMCVELLEPYGESSPIVRSLREGVKLLHLCFEVSELEAALDECRGAGFHRISQAIPSPVFHGRRIVWVFSRYYGLFELLEREGRGERESNSVGSNQLS